MASPPQPCFPAPGLAWADAQRWLSGSRVGCPAAAPLLHFPLAGTPPTSALLRLAWLTLFSLAPPALTRSLSPFTPHPPLRTCITALSSPSFIQIQAPSASILGLGLSQVDTWRKKSQVLRSTGSQA